jgi:hypothetical protein
MATPVVGVTAPLGARRASQTRTGTTGGGERDGAVSRSDHGERYKAAECMAWCQVRALSSAELLDVQSAKSTTLNAGDCM